MTIFNRTSAEPVLWPESYWEASNVGEPTVKLEDGLMKMWYTGGDGNTAGCAIGFATSDDLGKTWTKYKANPILGQGRWAASAAHSTVFDYQDNRYLFYSTHDAIYGVKLLKDVIPAHTPVKVFDKSQVPWAGPLGLGNSALYVNPNGSIGLMFDCGTVDNLWKPGFAHAYPGNILGPYYHNGQCSIAGLSGSWGAMDIHPDGDKLRAYILATPPGQATNLPSYIYETSVAISSLLAWSTPQELLRTELPWAFDQVGDPSVIEMIDRDVMLFSGCDNRSGARMYSWIGRAERLKAII